MNPPDIFFKYIFPNHDFHAVDEHLNVMPRCLFPNAVA